MANSFPEPCDLCREYGGNYVLVVNRRGVEGMGRCQCARGLALAALDRARRETPRPNVEPVITSEAATWAAGMLSAIPFYPADSGARAAIADSLLPMCNSADELIWLVRRMIALFNRWPGVPAMRAVYCSRFIPLDRIVVDACCEQFPDGVPSEIPAASETPLLGPGDAELRRKVRELGESKDLNKAVGRALPCSKLED